MAAEAPQQPGIEKSRASKISKRNINGWTYGRAVGFDRMDHSYTQIPGLVTLMQPSQCPDLGRPRNATRWAGYLTNHRGLCVGSNPTKMQAGHRGPCVPPGPSQISSLYKDLCAVLPYQISSFYNDLYARLPYQRLGVDGANTQKRSIGTLPPHPHFPAVDPYAALLEEIDTPIRSIH